ncbi:MAG: transposase [Ignavibacteriaceae bacterium]|nr:transposase [Ignavibacteriaceae bacterium]
MENLKNAIGIDVSSEKLDVCLSSITTDGKVTVIASNNFANSKVGFKKLMQWGRKVNKNNTLPLLYIMEETGFYYEALAYFLNENNCKVVLVLPSKVKKYMQSLPMKTKTDKVGARDLAQLGLEREHTLWVPPIEIDKILWDLSRERELKIERIVKTKNQIMELNKSQDKNPNTVKRLEVEIEFLNKHINEIEKEINLILESDPELKEKVEKL